MHDLLFTGEASCASPTLASRLSKPPGQLTLDLGIEIAADPTASKWLNERGANAGSAVVALIHSAANEDWRPRASVLGPYIAELERWLTEHIIAAPGHWLLSAELTRAFMAHMRGTGQACPTSPNRVAMAIAHAIERRWRSGKRNDCRYYSGCQRGFRGLGIKTPGAPLAGIGSAIRPTAEGAGDVTTC